MAGTSNPNRPLRAAVVGRFPVHPQLDKHAVDLWAARHGGERRGVQALAAHDQVGVALGG